MRIALPLVLLGSLASAQDDKSSQPITPPEVQKAMVRAEVHNKRVLLVLADKADTVLKKLKSNRQLSRKMLYEFECVPVEGDATKLWSNGGELPMLALADADGKVLARFAAGTFLKEGGDVDAAILDKWTPHFCKPRDADKKLSAALAIAKKSNRYVMVRFDAPW